MARQRIAMSLVVVVMVMLLGGAMAQSGCTTALMSMSSCLNYVTGSSSTPSSSCCSQLSSVVQSQPRCLCSLLNGGGSSLGVAINQTLALALPGACNVQTPPISQCNSAANGPAVAPSPATSPVSSPADASNDAPLSSPADASNNVPENPTPSVPAIPSGTASKTVPTPGTSGGNIINSSFGITVTALFLSALASIVIKV